MAKKKRKRWVQGKDFDYWVWRATDGRWHSRGYYTEKQAKDLGTGYGGARLCRAKFVEVPCKP